MLLSGEAGIGKSRLVQVLTAQVAAEPRAWLAPCQCSPYYQHTALYPLIDLLERMVLRFDREESPQQKVGKLEGFLVQYGLPLAEAVPLLAALLSLPLPADYAPLTVSPEQQKQQTLHAPGDAPAAHRRPAARALCHRRPALGRSVHARAAQPPGRSRPHRQHPDAVHLPAGLPPALDGAGPSHPAHGQPLAPHQAVEVIRQVAHGKVLPPEVVEQIVAKTDGVPLFVEELTKMVLESGLLQEQDERYALTGPLHPLAIPATLHDSLMARLDRLAAVKALAQLGATLGREFSYALLRAVAPWEEETCTRDCTSWWPRSSCTSGGCHRRPPTRSSMRSSRTWRISRCCGAPASSTISVLPRRWRPSSRRSSRRNQSWSPSTTRRRAATEQAVAYWQRAGQQASDRSAHLEAISHVTTGIELLKTLPETPEHTQQALTLYIALGAALLMTKGHAAPEVEHAYTQAHALCQQVGETPELVPVLFGLWRFYVGRPQLHTAREIGETLLRLAQRADDPALAVIAHYALGTTWLCLGALPAARLHLEEGHRTLHARPAPCAGVPHGPRSGCWLPSLCRSDPLVAGVPGASPGPPPRGPGVGARAVASL